MNAEKTPNQSQRIWISCTIAGLIVLLSSFFVMSAFPADGAGYARGYGAPVYAFEFARTQEDLTRIFGKPGDPQRERRIREMNTGNLWDYPFMVCYGAFMTLFCLGLAKESGRRAWMLCTGFGVGAAFADAIENLFLLNVTADIETAPGLGYVVYAVWTKFFFIMFCGLAASAYLIRTPGPIWKGAGLITALGSLSVAFAFWQPATYGWTLSQGIGVTWLLMLIYAGTRAGFRKIEINTNASNP